jgi:ATP-binding cassette subfamily B protein
VRLRRARSEDLPKVRPDRVTIRRLVALGRPEAPRLVVGTVFLLIGAAASLAYPQGIKNLINGALRGTDIAAIDHEAMKMVVVALIFGISVAIRFILFSVAGERVVTGLRERLYRSIIDQEIAFFDSRRTGELISRLAADTSVLQSAVSVNVSMALRSLAQAAGGVALLVYTSRQLTVVMLAVVPAVALGAVIYGKRVRRLARDVQDAMAAAGEVAEESIGGIRTVRAFVAEQKEAERYAGASARPWPWPAAASSAGGQFMAIASTASFAAAALVIWYGGPLVLRHQMDAGPADLVPHLHLIVAMALGGLAELWADFMRAAGAPSGSSSCSTACRPFRPRAASSPLT